jgi:hypothetical protein
MYPVWRFTGLAELDRAVWKLDELVIACWRRIWTRGALCFYCIVSPRPNHGPTELAIVGPHRPDSRTYNICIVVEFHNIFYDAPYRSCSLPESVFDGFARE